MRWNDFKFCRIAIIWKRNYFKYNYSYKYTSSNAVKGIVAFDMIIVCKHKAFYCQTTTGIYPNLGNTPIYIYNDIDMRNCTQTGYVQIKVNQMTLIVLLELEHF